MLTEVQNRPCPTPEKQRYISETEAQMAADYYYDNFDHCLNPYLCPCGLWHLTTPMGLKGQQADLARNSRSGTKSARTKQWFQRHNPNARTTRGKRPKA